jgi:hypothetical protein
VLSEEGPRAASGVLTFLFTDIEGSTRRWEADPKAMRAALDAHHDVLTRAVASHGGRDQTRTAHAHFFAAREGDALALWDSPRQREAYGWFALELANLRAAFRWAADRDDIDTAATIATYAAFIGTLVEQYEPLACAEEIIEPARALQHRRLAALYVTVTQIYLIGRIDDAIRYSESAQNLTGNGVFDSFTFGYGAYHGSPYIAVGRPERMGPGVSRPTRTR